MTFLRYQSASRRRSRRVFQDIAGAASALAVFGCSGGSSPSGAEGGSLNAAPDTTPAFVVDGDELAGNPGLPAGIDGSGCLGETRQAEAISLDMFVMLDISGSMLDPLPAAPTSTKWDAVRSSLEAFVRAPDTAGIGIGLQYFPQANAGVPFACSTNTDCGAGGPCTSSLCVTRAELPDAEGGAPLEFLRRAGGAGTLCSTDVDCSASGGSCRSLLGACVFPPGASTGNPAPHFANVSETPESSVVPALCDTDEDCAGVPGSLCEVVGLCSLAPFQCTPSVGCAPGAGTCAPFPYTCTGYTSCDTTRYEAPALEIAQSRADDVVASLRAQVPAGATPTGPALAGALEQARLWAADHPGRQVVTVLATDGFPTVCEPRDIPSIAGLASTAAAAPNPVRSFVIGVFGDADLGADGPARLDAIARAGGSERAILVDTAGDVASEFLDALNAIRSTAVSCDFELSPDLRLDFDRVNLLVTPSDGTPAPLSSVSDRAACEDGDGWYYVRDSAGTPLRLSVCPATCAKLERELVRVDLQIGCVTRIR